MSLSQKGKSTSKNFVLRIAKEEWFKQVFALKKYYPGILRRWEKGSLIFLAKRSDKGDSFVGYGVMEEFVKENELPDEEKRKCKNRGWKGAIIFSELYKFDPPLLIKETILGNLGIRGRCWHGYKLTEEQTEAILEAAEELCNIRKV